MLVMNVELHWLDPLSGLEIEAFMEIVNQYNSEDNMEKSEIMFWTSTIWSKIIGPFTFDEDKLT